MRTFYGLLFVLLTFFASIGRSQGVPQVLQRLDQGGVALSVTDGAYEYEAVSGFYELMRMFMEKAIEESRPGGLTGGQREALRGLVSRLGLDQVSARGDSTIAMEGGGYRSRSVLNLKEGADGLLWNLTGTPSLLAGDMGRLPATTAT